MVIGFGLPLLVWWRARGRLEPRELLIACALALLLRCTLDPGSAAYYHLPLLLTLVTLDGWEGRNLPVAGLSGTAIAFVVLDRFPQYLPAGAVEPGVHRRQCRGCGPARPAAARHQATAHEKPCAADNSIVTARTHRLPLFAASLAFAGLAAAVVLSAERQWRLPGHGTCGRRQCRARAERADAR